MVHGSPGQQAAGEDGDHAGLAVGVLAGAVDVGQGQGGELEVVQLAVGVRGSRRPPSWPRRRATRALRVRLLDRQLGRVGLAVERAAAGGEHHLAGCRPARAPSSTWSAADDVDVGVEDRPGHRDPHVGLGGQVEDHLGPAPGHQLDDAGDADVELVEGELVAGVGPGLGQVGQRAGREVVDHVDGVALGQQPVDEGGADEAGAAGDQARFTASARARGRRSERTAPGVDLGARRRAR